MKRIRSKILPFIAYFAGFAVILAVMFLGSLSNEATSDDDPILSSLNDADFVVTADQLSESYIVADVANVVHLPSVLSINENYTSIAMKYEVAGASAGANTLSEKPNIIDTSNLNRDIIQYVVQEGDTMDSIVARCNSSAVSQDPNDTITGHCVGITSTQIRWSNDLKNDNLTVGKVLYISPMPGILYTVGENDTVESIADKYGSSVEQIIAYNDLETGNLSSGATIILPDGELPETERPEYVPPTPVYTYVRDLGNRTNRVQLYNYDYWRNMYYSTSWQNNPGAFGNCTWYAWYWRRNNMSSEYWLPTGTIGNAGTWTYAAWSNAYIVNRTPAYGAVVQTSTGSPGHVGVVVGVNPGVNITIEEMNYGDYPRLNRVFRSNISWSDALTYRYIHAKKQSSCSSLI